MEYETCAQCENVILRLPGGMWEHLDARDWSHMPEARLPMLTEEQAERELQRSQRMGLVDAGDGLHYDPTAADFVKVIRLRGEFL